VDQLQMLLNNPAEMNRCAAPTGVAVVREAQLMPSSLYVSCALNFSARLCALAALVKPHDVVLILTLALLHHIAASFVRHALPPDSLSLLCPCPFPSVSPRRLLHKGSAPNLHRPNSMQGLSGSLPGSPAAASSGPLQAAAAAGRLSMDNLAAMHGSLPNQGMMHHAGGHAKMPFGHGANNAFRAVHRASSDSSLAAAMAAAAGLGSGPNSPCSPALMAAHAAAAANHSSGGSPAADLAALQAAAVSGGASSSSGGGRLSRLSNSSSAFTDGPGGMGHMQPPCAGSALQGPLSSAHQQQQAAGMQGGHLGRAHSAPAPGPLLAAQQQQAALAAGKAGMAAKHGDQQAMMQRIYGAGDRSTLSPPGLLSGRHAAAAAPAGSEGGGVPFSMGMNIRPVAGGQAGGLPLSPDAVRDTVGVRDTGAAAAAAYTAAEVQAQMQQQALAHQEQQVRETPGMYSRSQLTYCVGESRVLPAMLATSVCLQVRCLPACSRTQCMACVPVLTVPCTAAAAASGPCC
jgi:hypothetical protein